MTILKFKTEPAVRILVVLIKDRKENEHLA